MMQKRDILSLLYVSIAQGWLFFNFPPFLSLGAPWNIIVIISINIICTLIYIYVFSNPTEYAPLYNFEIIGDAPEALIARNILKKWNVIAFHFGMFFVWYKDLYGASNTYYLLCYIHCVITYILIIRAMMISKRNPKT